MLHLPRTRYTATHFLMAGYAALILLLPSCSGSQNQAYADLKRAANVVRHMSAPRQIRQSSFSTLAEKGTPSQFVNWLFSSLGAADWPPSEASADSMEREQARVIHAPLIPAGVGIVPWKVNPEAGQQVVVKADDERGVIIVEGYLQPDGPPVFKDEWEFSNPKK